MLAVMVAALPLPKCCHTVASIKVWRVNTIARLDRPLVSASDARLPSRLVTHAPLLRMLPSRSRQFGSRILSAWSFFHPRFTSLFHFYFVLTTFLISLAIFGNISLIEIARTLFCF